jgi:thioesterase domain-containing protein
LGWSSGGLIAMAIARALEDQGCAVQYVGLLDTQAMQSEQVQDADALMMNAAINIMETMRSRPFNLDELTRMHAVLAQRKMTIADLLDDAHADFALQQVQKWIGMTMTPELFAHLKLQLQTTQHHMALLWGYSPQPVKARLHRYNAREADYTLVEFTAQPEWGVVPHSHHHTDIVDGDHFSMIGSQHAKALASTITAHVRALARPTPTNTDELENA